MAATTATLTKLIEDIDRVERDLKAKQTEITQIVAENVELLNENKKTEAQFQQLSAFLKTTKQRNTSAKDQVGQEYEQAVKNFEYDEELRSKRLEKFALQRKRYLELKEENEELEYTIRRYRQQLTDSERKQASEVHEMNKEMKLTRQQMEATLRRELTNLDMSYQSEAFGLLDDKQKQAMLINSRLKDEVAIQGVGIANLTVRLDKQNLLYSQTKRDITKLNRKARNLRNYLGQLRMEKHASQRSIRTLHGVHIKLMKQKEDLANEINRDPSIIEVERAIENCNLEIRKHVALAKMWSERFRRVLELNRELKPVSFAEAAGHFSSQLFPIASVTAVPHVVDLVRHNQLTIQHDDLADLMEEDSRNHPRIEAALPSPSSPTFSGPSSPVSLRSASLHQKDLQDLDGKTTDHANHHHSTLSHQKSSFLDPLPVAAHSEQHAIDEMLVINALSPSLMKESCYSTQRSPLRPAHPYTASVKLTDVVAARERDACLEIVLRILKDKESVLLSATSEIPNHGDSNRATKQNMVAWATYEILKLWEETEQLQLKFQSELPDNPSSEMLKVDSAGSPQQSHADDGDISSLEGDLSDDENVEEDDGGTKKSSLLIDGEDDDLGDVDFEAIVERFNNELLGMVPDLPEDLARDYEIVIRRHEEVETMLNDELSRSSRLIGNEEEILSYQQDFRSELEAAFKKPPHGDSSVRSLHSVSSHPEKSHHHQQQRIQSEQTPPQPTEAESVAKPHDADRASPESIVSKDASLSLAKNEDEWIEFNAMWEEIMADEEQVKRHLRRKQEKQQEMRRAESAPLLETNDSAAVDGVEAENEAGLEEAESRELLPGAEAKWFRKSASMTYFPHADQNWSAKPSTMRGEIKAKLTEFDILPPVINARDSIAKKKRTAVRKIARQHQDSEVFLRLTGASRPKTQQEIFEQLETASIGTRLSTLHPEPLGRNRSTDPLAPKKQFDAGILEKVVVDTRALPVLNNCMSSQSLAMSQLRNRVLKTSEVQGKVNALYANG